MICIAIESVLLIASEKSMLDVTSEQSFESGWMRIDTDRVGELLRQVRFYQAGVVVFDLSGLTGGEEACLKMLGVMSAVRARLPKVTLAVLGSADEPAVEQAARSRGAVVYLPIAREQNTTDVRQVIQALRARHGPMQTHGPPASGVPPR